MSDAKYEIAFYQTRDGECQVWDFLEGLRMKAATKTPIPAYGLHIKRIGIYFKVCPDTGRMFPFQMIPSISLPKNGKLDYLLLQELLTANV